MNKNIQTLVTVPVWCQRTASGAPELLSHHSLPSAVLVSVRKFTRSEQIHEMFPYDTKTGTLVSGDGVPVRRISAGSWAPPLSQPQETRLLRSVSGVLEGKPATLHEKLPCEIRVMQ